MKFRISTFEELINYCKQPEVEFDEIQKITSEGLKIYFVKQHPKEKAIQLLIVFWAKWGHSKEKPLFIERH